MPRMKLGPIVPIRHIDPPVPGNRVRLNRRRGRHAVLPRLLHLGVHHEQRVVREVDGDLALGVVVLVWGEDAADAELARDAEGERADDGARAEVG